MLVVPGSSQAELTSNDSSERPTRSEPIRPERRPGSIVITTGVAARRVGRRVVAARAAPAPVEAAHPARAQALTIATRRMSQADGIATTLPRGKDHHKGNSAAVVRFRDG